MVALSSSQVALFVMSVAASDISMVSMICCSRRLHASERRPQETPNIISISSIAVAVAVAVAAGGAAAATAGCTLPFVVVGWRSLQDFC